MIEVMSERQREEHKRQGGSGNMGETAVLQRQTNPKRERRKGPECEGREQAD